MERSVQKRRRSPKVAAAGHAMMTRVAVREANQLRERAQRRLFRHERPLNTDELETARQRGLRYLKLDEAFAVNPYVKIVNRQRALGASALLLAVGGENDKAADALMRLMDLEEQATMDLLPVMTAQGNLEERLQELWIQADAIRSN